MGPVYGACSTTTGDIGNPYLSTLIGCAPTSIGGAIGTLNSSSLSVGFIASFHEIVVTACPPVRLDLDLDLDRFECLDRLDRLDRVLRRPTK